MRDLENTGCETHILICTNERGPNEKPSCARFGGMEFFKNFKQKMKDSGLARNHWVTRTGCLGYCNEVGTTVAIHKKGKETRWMTEVTANDFEKVWKEVTDR